jgi:SAM-dependent methyltransferase
MKASQFDQQHFPTFSVQEGYTALAATYDEKKVGTLLTYPLLERIQTVPWGHLEAVADLACGTGRTGIWLKEHGVRFLDGVDLTEAMLEQARLKGIYRHLSLADLRQTPLGAHSYDLVSVGLADDHLAEVLPLYQEAARLILPKSYLVLVGYHPFFQLGGVPATFELPTGEPAAIEGYIHLFSEHIQAANASGWLLRELHERLIDDAWIAERPRAAPRKGWPVSFVCVWQQQPWDAHNSSSA